MKRKLTRINPKIEGWIEKAVYVDFTKSWSKRASLCSASTVPTWSKRSRNTCSPSKEEDS